MDSQIFFDNFATIAEAADGVERLRDLVLDLGLRGQLTKPQPTDGCGADILAAIAGERQKRGTKSRAKRADTPDPPHEIPDHWAWARLDEIARYNDRPKVAPSSIDPAAWSLDLEDVQKSSSRLLRRVSVGDRPSSSTKCAFAAGDVLYGKLRPYLDKVLVS